MKQPIEIMSYNEVVLDFAYQVKNCINAMRDTIPFIQQHELWKGMRDHKFVAGILAIISLLFSVFVLGDIVSVFGDVIKGDVVQSGLSSNMGEVSDAVKKEGKDAFFSGGTRYLLIILLEVVIFHFAVKTLSILTQEKRSPVFKDFLNAEFRMISVMFRNFLKGLVIHFFIYIAFSIFGIKDLTSVVMFFVYAYFIGFAFFDNYNEQFGKTIRESQGIIKQHRWASTTLGITVSGLIFVPFIGPVIAPILASIAAIIYANRYNIEWQENASS